MEGPTVTIAQLWLPILLSAVLVHLASFVVWMVLPFHRTDRGGVKDEEALRDALKRQGLAPGEYVVPWRPDPKAMNDPAFVRKFEEGPVALLTVLPAGRPTMGKNLTQWFVYLLVLSIFLAYLASRTVQPGADYLAIFRVVGTAALLAHAAGSFPAAIWFGKPWRTVWKDMVDAVVYALLTAGAFAGLWPR
ncbi:MAG TPA: hypothetical protein VNK43_07255 [Gemmatimonadales bacterium]|nr:hypothetical protein [Gemmatimonadales bacterium]